MIENESLVDKPKKRGTTRKGVTGGARPGSGRKKGSGNKLTAANLLREIDLTLGVPFEKQLAQNYQTAIIEQDRAIIAKYDALIISKVVTDSAEIDITTNGNNLNGAQLIFVTAKNPGFPDDEAD